MFISERIKISRKGVVDENEDYDDFLKVCFLYYSFSRFYYKSIE